MSDNTLNQWGCPLVGQTIETAVKNGGSLYQGNTLVPVAPQAQPQAQPQAPLAFLCCNAFIAAIVDALIMSADTWDTFQINHINRRFHGVRLGGVMFITLLIATIGFLLASSVLAALALMMVWLMTSYITRWGSVNAWMRLRAAVPALAEPTVQIERMKRQAQEQQITSTIEALRDKLGELVGTQLDRDTVAVLWSNIQNLSVKQLRERKMFALKLCLERLYMSHTEVGTQWHITTDTLLQQVGSNTNIKASVQGLLSTN